MSALLEKPKISMHCGLNASAFPLDRVLIGAVGFDFGGGGNV
jgi:hypothetical protein